MKKSKVPLVLPFCNRSHENSKNRALAEAASHHQFHPHFFDKAMDNGESKARAATNLFGGEKGFKAAVKLLGVHAGTVIFDLEDKASVTLILVKADNNGGDVPSTFSFLTGGYGVTGIGEEIDDNLLEFLGVCLDEGQVRVDFFLQNQIAFFELFPEEGEGQV